MADSEKTSVKIIDRVTTDQNGSSEKVTLWQSVKIYPKVVGYCVGVTAAILLYGYDLAIVGTVSAMPEFQYASQIHSPFSHHLS